MALGVLWPARVAWGHWRTTAGAAAALAAYALLPPTLGATTRAVLAWDIGALLLLGLVAVLFLREGGDAAMAQHARQQQEGEWAMFWVTLAGVAFSFMALTSEMGSVKEQPPGERTLRVALVAGTLLVSWLVTHVVFALRYAHEYYAKDRDPDRVDGGLDFPGHEAPDYWDFTYFALVLGMTFQVSDVSITSRKMRRLATVHGLIGFLFNTVIVALTVNIAASLLN